MIKIEMGVRLGREMRGSGRQAGLGV